MLPLTSASRETNLRPRIVRLLTITLGFFVLLTIAAFFLAENGRINNFPSYLVGILFIPFCLLTRPSLPDHRLIGAISLLLAYLGISALWGTDPRFEQVLLHWGYGLLIITFVLSLVLLCGTEPRFFDWLIWFAIACGFVSCTYSIYLHLAYPDYQPLPEPERMVGLGRLHNPTVSALAYGFCAVLCIHKLFCNSITRRTIAAVCLVTLFIGIVYSGTRSAWIGIGSATIAAFLIHLRIATGLKLIVAIMTLTSASAVLIYVYGWEELIRRSTSFRPEIWNLVIQKTYEGNLLVGLGVTTDSTLEYGVYTFHHAHSIFFATLYHAGLIGISGLLMLVLLCCHKLYHANNSETRQIAITSFVYSMAVLVLNGGTILIKVDLMWIVFWLPIALVMMTGVQARTTDNSY